MNIATRISNTYRLLAATKWGSYPPRDPAILKWLSAGRATSSDEAVTPESALGATAVLAATRLISETIASLPMHVFKKTSTVREKAQAHWLQKLLADEPNKVQTSFEFYCLIVVHMLLRGAAYVYKVPGTTNPVDELVILHPDQVTQFYAPDGKVAYRYSPLSGKAVVFLDHEIIPFRGLCTDPIKPRSVIDLAPESIGLALAADKYAGRFFSNDATPTGLLTRPGAFTVDEEKNFMEGWQAARTGDNRHKTALLQEDMKYQQLGLSAQDSQLIETRKFQVTDIARIFRVPPHMIADMEAATFSNIEHQGIDFARHTIRPWLVRMEQALKRGLFDTPKTETFFPEWSMDGLLRGDQKSRYESYALSITNGFKNFNEVRALENDAPREGGDEFVHPANMVPSNGVTFTPPTNDRMQAIIKGAASRIATKEMNAVKRVKTRHEGEALIAALDKLYTEITATASEAVGLPVTALTGWSDNAKQRALAGDVNQVITALELIEIGGNS